MSLLLFLITFKIIIDEQLLLGRVISSFNEGMLDYDNG